MAEGDFQDLARQVLLGCLDAQRASVLAIVNGLDEDALRAVVVPSGWTPLDLIEHLGYAERHWFQRVAMGSAALLPWPNDAGEDDDAPFTTSRPAEARVRLLPGPDRARERRAGLDTAISAPAGDGATAKAPMR